MKSLSRRGRRISRHQALRKAPSLNLVSLMDIFTILVFFLLVNTSTEQELPSSKALTLPTSVSETPPEQTLKVAITPREVLVQGRRVMSVEALTNDSESGAEPLKEELAYRRSLSMRSEEDTLTIIADKGVDYSVIRQVIQASRELAFSRIAFAANQVTEESDGSAPAPNQ